jgi:hypothetical protein
MAINVYLVFFHRFDAARLKKLYWLYGLICYGLPFIPAIFCLFYSSKKKGKMYGDATVSPLPSPKPRYPRQSMIDNGEQLWCWIDTPYATVRIYSYYAPVWLAILLALLIYLLVGLQIFKHRSRLHQAHKNNLSSLSSLPSHPGPPFPSPPFSGTKTTHVEVTSHEPPQPTFARGGNGERSGGGRYSINITSLPFPTSSHGLSFLHLKHKNKHKSISNMNRIKYAYTRVAILFCTSILITWVPASINRVYGLKHPNTPSFGLNAVSAVVLPLQGFWNTVIYFVTSLGIWREVVEGWRVKRAKGRGKEGGLEIMHLGERRVDNVDVNEDGLESEGEREKDVDSTVGLHESERSSREPV